MVEYADGLWHCIHPDWLADQLTRSLDRLGLETLDLLLLHNPEYFLADAAKSAGVPVQFNICGSMFCAYFTSQPVHNLDDAMKSDREKCLQAGASDYIAKPVNPDQLVSLLSVWLYR